MKRGISPIVSWVLIVAFAISIAMIVIPTLIDRVKDWDFDPDINYCEDVSLSVDVENICVANGELKIPITNNGDFTIQKLTIGITTDVLAEQWCEYISGAIPLPPSVGSDLLLRLDKKYSFDITLEDFVDCVSGAGANDAASKIEIVPWIKPDPELEIMHCDDRKIILSNDLNTPC
ncbi:hypothetical protein K8R33_02415 [archaeon]|nr:hypothetical protein [archaeon]